MGIVCIKGFLRNLANFYVVKDYKGGISLDLRTIFEYSIERHPHKVAIIEGDKRYTYRQLGIEVNNVASSLHKLGVNKHDRLAVLLKNRFETVVIFWAIQKLGAIYAGINVRQSQEIVHYCLSDLESKFVIYDASTEYLINKKRFIERPVFINIDGNDGDINYEELKKQEPYDFTPNQIIESDLAVILYTSGTTGNPKGVPRSHQNEYLLLLPISSNVIMSGMTPR